MFSFLNPGLLWALPLAGAPVILHLIFMRRARKVRFSDLTLLRAAYAGTLRASRLRQWLILLLRCLIIAGIVFVFTRPVLHQDRRGSGGSEAGLDVVLLADTSWSMGAKVRGKTRMALANEVGARLIAMLRPADRAAVAAFSEGLEGELRWSRDRAAAAESLTRLRPGNRRARLAPALEAAYRFLAGGPRDAGRRRVIVTLSDGAGDLVRTLPPGGLKSIPGYDPAVALLGISWEDWPENAGINEVLASFESGEGGGRPSLLARTALYARGTRESFVDLWVRGKRVDQRSFSLEPGAARTAAFRLPSSRETDSWGMLSVMADDLSADDAYFYSLRLQKEPKVLLLYGSPRYLEAGRGGYFLKKLLVDGRRLPYHLEVADLGRFDQIAIEEYGAVLLADFRELPAGMAEALERYVARGGGLFLLAGTRAGPETYRRLKRLVPAELGPDQGPLARGLTIAARDIPLPGGRERRSFDWKDFELQNVSVERRYALSPKPGAAIWFVDGTGKPLMAGAPFGRGRVLIWGSSLDIDWSNLALKPVFTAWMDAGLRWLSGYSGRHDWRTLTVGEPIIREWRLDEKAPARVQIRGPGGRRAVLVVRDRRAEFRDTREPGIYHLTPSGPDGGAAADSQEDVFAVNLDRAGPEGDLEPKEAPFWRALRPGALREDFLRSVYGREVRTAVLFLVVLLLLLETLLSRPRVLGPVTAAALLLAVFPLRAAAQLGDVFEWAQVRYTGAWDPYPGTHAEALKFVTDVTSVLAAPKRREVSLKSPELFETPFVLLSGKQAPPALDGEEIGRLRDYLTSGGFLWIEDATGIPGSPFDAWVRTTLGSVLPDSDLKPLPKDHVLFKTFFLMRRIGGRVMISGSVEGVEWAGKTVVVYSRNDLLGAWAKDPLGNFLYECVPGGEAQRMQARKLTLNIVMYALTGSYKADAVHQQFILQKMRTWSP